MSDKSDGYTKSRNHRTSEIYDGYAKNPNHRTSDKSDGYIEDQSDRYIKDAARMPPSLAPRCSRGLHV